ncbi:MAG TPA: NUDIX hydrolase [Anaerolineales bacterium]|nr:NUDIX hydrolase [Anaerolineales bacterium]
MASEDKIVYSNRWFTISERSSLVENQLYYVLNTLDYVSIFARTIDKEVLLVRQFRPVVQDYTLEIPSGHVEHDKTPEEAARQELLEETGFIADHVHFLGVRASDTGRLGNRIWFFFADGVTQQSESIEEGIEVVRCSMKEFFEFMKNGQIIQSFNLALVQLAFLHGLLSVEEMITK